MLPALAVLLPRRWGHLGPAMSRAVTLPRASWTDPSELARVSIAIMVGAGSHILWDSFTYAPPPGVRSLAWLGWFPFSIGGTDLHSTRWVNWLSTGLGLTVSLMALARWSDRQVIGPPDERALAAPGFIRAGGWAFVAVITLGFAVRNPLALLGGAPPEVDPGLRWTTASIWALTGRRSR